MSQRVVLAYSGGLDTSVAVRWIQEEWGAEVVALAVDVGQEADDPYGTTIRARALAAGAIEARVVDARDEFADDFLVNAIQANALYEGKYPLVSALSRPVIARAPRGGGAASSAPTRWRTAARARATTRCASRCPLRTLAPDLEVLAPVRMWGFTRDDSIDYAAKLRHPDQRSPRRARTRSTRTSGAGPSSAARSRTRGSSPPADAYALTRDVADAPTESAGGRRAASSRACRWRSTASATPLHELVIELGARPSAPTASVASTWWRTGASASRAVRSTSARASLALLLAHADLESITLERDLMREKAASRPVTRSWCTTACGSRR